MDWLSHRDPVSPGVRQRFNIDMHFIAAQERNRPRRIVTRQTHARHRLISVGFNPRRQLGAVRSQIVIRSQFQFIF